MSPKSFLAALLCALALAGPAVAADKAAEAVPAPAATYEQTKKFVDRAVAHLKKVGPEKAFADFNDASGKWIDGDLYIFVFDMKGVYKATGFRPERTGSNAWDMKDATGQMYVVREIIKKAKRDGEALVDYLWKNPATGKIQNKTSYVVKVGDHVVGAGFYHQ
ncbi:MAG: cache domain-containing protein [Pseudomonadota bacterium]